MRVLNPWTQRLLTAKPRGKPPASSFFCDYPQRMESVKARGDPKGRYGRKARSRGDSAPTSISTPIFISTPCGYKKVETVREAKNRGDPGE